MSFCNLLNITGSVSRGLADEESDVEIEFIADNLIPEHDKINWIKQIGRTQVHPYGAQIVEGSVWIVFKYKDCWVEVGWQVADIMIDNIKSIIAGKFYTHDKLILAATLKNAISIRKNRLLSSLQEKLSV